MRADAPRARDRGGDRQARESSRLRSSAVRRSRPRARASPRAERMPRAAGRVALESRPAPTQASGLAVKAVPADARAERPRAVGRPPGGGGRRQAAVVGARSARRARAARSANTAPRAVSSMRAGWRRAPRCVRPRPRRRARQRRAAVEVGDDTAHGVVRGGRHGHGLRAQSEPGSRQAASMPGKRGEPRGAVAARWRRGSTDRRPAAPSAAIPRATTSRGRAQPSGSTSSMKRRRPRRAARRPRRARPRR